MPARLTRAQQQQLTRQRLLDASLGVFRQRGFAAATIEEITELAGYTRGAFYSHFESKEEAFLAVVESNTEHQLELFRSAALAARSEVALLRLIIGSTVPTAAGAQGHAMDRTEVVMRLADSPDLRARALRVQEQLEDVMGWCAEELCRRRGCELGLPRKTVGVAMLAFLTGLGQRLRLDPDMAIERQALFGLRALVFGDGSSSDSTATGRGTRG